MISRRYGSTSGKCGSGYGGGWNTTEKGRKYQQRYEQEKKTTENPNLCKLKDTS